ncbi:carbohydrate ABC transporter permease [Agromyces cerinus]|uniref:Multiple sugar transport system permease protein/sn-glycerol 3-phosphate transport system permease protein n=1 Tax=Agromyces cerinus subsp. cerinus TaxID=232089 RepID=A0A1N6GHL7_9MICO|nr:sugar ABC transporter permease [Agromyces cerinus]SIO06951.1 multiple sugar transport system permease protein/sn-glycerol 3-phosphate transport system permease protein [Agromyces cerinus subsp. cerinus]
MTMSPQSTNRLATAASVALEPEGTAPASKRRRRVAGRLSTHVMDNRTAYVMIAPMVVLLGMFVWWPLLYSFYLSTFEISFYEEPVFVGLQFYGYVLEDPDFWHSIGIGATYVLYTVPAIMIIAFLVASFIRTVGRKVAGLLKTTVYVPTVVSAVITSVVFVFMYRADGGLINWLIGFVGLGPFAFLSDPELALPAISVPGIWLAFGITTLIMLAGMYDIPQSYYEAAQLEGANFFQRTWFITIPLMKNVLLYLVVTATIAGMQQFELPLIMTQGGPTNSTMTPNLFIFNQFKDPTPYATSFSLTAALILFFVLGGISMLIFRLIRSDKAIDA